jgi:aspartate carbamoyltransferase catalytic subunit
LSGLNGRSVISIDDLSIDDIETIFDTADDIRDNLGKYQNIASSRILATLFHEPSTRTRLSFESSMQRLGGSVISTSDVNSSSTVKGESLADTSRVIGAYSDLIVIRHPLEGAAKLAAEYSQVPVINGGDGRHEHPTQTLCDLYTLRQRHGSLTGLKVALCGDLLNGRTIHSLAFALARFGANIIFVPGDGNDVPQYVLRRLEKEYSAHIQREQLGILSALFSATDANSEPTTVDAIYITPKEPHQLSMTSIEGTAVQFQRSSEDALSIYVTRPQKERSNDPNNLGSYPTLNAKVLEDSNFKNISILHPLPRVDELSPDVDSDPRSLYFQQAALSVPVRMALIYHVLGLGIEESAVIDRKYYKRNISGLLHTQDDFECSNESCIKNHERSFVSSEFEIIRDDQYKLRCLYCDTETPATHVGNIQSKIYYPSNHLDRILPAVLQNNVRFFDSEKSAQLSGYRALASNWRKYHPEPDKQNDTWIERIRKLSY